ncbi:PspA/IM30 family protein [Paenibacillus sp. MBLB2552]|uniref:PspA/IM30 family protein n=1 Tax=Paenibacillus mellifer TaxID=2937794 RepID=A0A9X1Y341_9BACL|nr:PspA/IM30 family protein [Paenibacillus mellifer]MCK8489899.1 PspA/IM30 family protein [Paenibacillus mellifer]
MGILARFRDVMRSNLSALLKSSPDPAAAVDAYMRQLRLDAGQVKAEATAVQAEEDRAKRALDECAEEVRKLQRYAEKAVESGDESSALKFLERKAKQAERLNGLQTAYEQAAYNSSKVKRMQDKLVSDLQALEARQAELKSKLVEAEALSRAQASGGSEAALRELEAKADQALNEALALAELRAGSQEDDLDAIFAELEKGYNATVEEKLGTPPVSKPEDELTALKAKINKQNS